MGSIAMVPEHVIKSAAREVLRTNEAYNAACRYTPFSAWYKGEHKKAGASLRRAARALRKMLRECGEYETVQERIADFLGAREGSSDDQRRDMITTIKTEIGE